MTDCCEYKCTQGRDCPIRKQRIEAVNLAYIERGRVDIDPYTDTIGSVKALGAWLTFVAIAGLVFWAWVK
jgi:hypothetical protein